MSQASITITPRKNSNGVIEWSLDYNGNVGSGGKYPSVPLKRNSGAHLFDININDPDGLGITFANYPDALWVGENVPCPPAKGINSDQIKGYHHTSPTQLMFVDLNNGAQRDLIYQLNFAPADTPPLDPEIKNGGTGPGIDLYMLCALLVGAIAGAGATYFSLQP